VLLETMPVLFIALQVKNNSLWHFSSISKLSCQLQKTGISEIVTREANAAV